MRDEEPLDVVVLDDVARFAAHVWQYFSANIGFGVGRMADNGFADGAPRLKEAEPYPTPAADVRVIWVNASSESWSTTLAAVLDEVGGKAIFLVDVRGPVRPSAGRYKWQIAREVLLKAGRGAGDIWLVSSYLTGSARPDRGKPVQIRPKNWRLLEDIAARAPGRKDGQLDGSQILVTGAGFELSEQQAGSYGLGMPSTYEILKKGWEGYKYAKSPQDFEDYSAFPVPNKLQGEKYLEAIAKSSEPNLDDYWDEALKLVLELGARFATKRGPRARKVAASQEEYQVRDALRHALLHYDWGHLGQALDAAELGWTAWLSTNYTGFADRALTLAKRYRLAARSWSIVSTSNEAVYLVRSILHGELGSEQESSVLFKLHGHVEHLLTMAIAGQDKEFYSTLSLPVDSLHEVYTAAERYLLRRLADDKSPVGWHIVGHGLQDALLVESVVRVCRNRPRRRHKFLIVNPDASLKEPGQLKEEVNDAQFIAIPVTASQYMARLRRRGLGADDWNDLEAWRDRLVG